MFKKNLLLGLALIFIALPLASAITTIGSCPTTITSSGAYNLSANISSTTTCITVNANNVDINCNGYAILYDSAGGNSQYGINALYGVIPMSNLTVRNCIIDDINSGGTPDYGIQLSRFSNSYIFNNTIWTNGTSSNDGLYLTTSSNSNQIVNNTINAFGTTTANLGINLISACDNNTITGNIINATGTTTSYALYISTNSNKNSS